MSLSIRDFSWRAAACASAVAGATVIVYSLRKNKVKSLCRSKTQGERNNPYESETFLNQYLAFNYGGPEVNCLFDCQKTGFDFPKVIADICKKHSKATSTIPSRALDIGCAVGRASFELAAEFSEVIGIDFSCGFVRTCEILKKSGQIRYEMPTQGDLTTKHDAIVPRHLDRSRCHFQEGDAGNLPLSLGTFGCVLASNVICRLPRPTDFLLRLASLVAPGGICVITSPYTFMEMYTPKSRWLGGYVNSRGEEVYAIDTMKQVLSPDFDLIDSIEVPFLIRETAREYLWAVSHVTVWKRK